MDEVVHGGAAIASKESRLSLHPEVRRRMEDLLARDRALEISTIMPSIWLEGRILPWHRQCFFIGSMGLYMIGPPPLRRALMASYLGRSLQDSHECRAVEMMSEIIDSLMEMDTTTDEAVKFIWSDANWGSIIDALLKSSTFSSDGFSYDIPREGIPSIFATMADTMMRHGRDSIDGDFVSLGECCDALLVETHNELLWGSLAPLRNAMSYGVLNHASARSIDASKKSQLHSWAKSLSPEVAKALFSIFDAWLRLPYALKMANSDEHAFSAYYRRNARHFTMERMEAFGALIVEYNVEWAMASFDWSSEEGI